MNSDRLEEENDKLEAMSDSLPSDHLSKREWNFYKKLKENIFSKNKHYSKKNCGKQPAVNKKSKDDKTDDVPERVKIKKRLYKSINDKLFDTPRSIKSFALQPYAKMYRMNRDLNRGQLTDTNGKIQWFSTIPDNKIDFSIRNIRKGRSKNESSSIGSDNSVEENGFITKNSESYNRIPLPKTNNLLDKQFILNISKANDSKISTSDFSKSVNKVSKLNKNNERSGFNNYHQNKLDMENSKQYVFKEFQNNPECVNTEKIRKKRSSYIYDSPDYYDGDLFEENRSTDNQQIDLEFKPNSFETAPDKTLNSNIDLIESAENVETQEMKDELITRNRKAIPISSLFSKSYIPSLKKEDRGCNVSDIIFPAKVGNTVVFRNRKISPIKSTDKFSYYNGTIISGACLVKKANYSISQLSKMPVYLKTLKQGKQPPALPQNSTISGSMSALSNDTSRKNRTNGFFTKMISYMKFKVSDAEVPSDKCTTIKVDKDVYYDIGKDLPLIAKSQDFKFSNGTVINGGALLKKAKYSKSKLKDILFMEYQSLRNNNTTNKSFSSKNASSVLNGSVPLRGLEVTTVSMDQKTNQSEFIQSVTINDRNLANVSNRIPSDNQAVSVSGPIQSLGTSSESAFSQKLPTNIMIGSFNRSSTTTIPVFYSTSNIASISSDKISPIEPDVFKQQDSTKTDKHQPTLLSKLMPVQEVVQNKTSTEIHRVPRTTSLRSTLSEPTTNISKAGFIQITPTPLLKNLGTDRTTPDEQNHSDMSTSQIAQIQQLNFNQCRTMKDQFLISITKQINPSSERTISNNFNNSSMDNQDSQNYISTTMNSLSSDIQEEIVTSAMASEDLSVVSNDDYKNLVTDDNVYTSSSAELADSRITTIDQQESNLISLEDNSSTSSLQIDTPLETESSSILSSTEAIIENSSVLSKETENNLILTSELADICASKENVQPKHLDSDRSLGSDQSIHQSYENTTFIGELVKVVDKLIIEHMFSTVEPPSLSTEPESPAIYANDYYSQPNDLVPCLFDKLQNKEFYLLNPDKNNLNEEFSAWHLHHTDQAVPCNMYFLEQSKENDPNQLEHKNRTVYCLDHSGYDYYYCPSHPDHVFLIQRGHENMNLADQQNYLHFIDLKNDNSPVKCFHYMENAEVFHNANLARDDNFICPDSNINILYPEKDKMFTHACHPYCLIHDTTPSSEANSISSNIESDYYYKLNNEITDNFHLLDHPSEIAVDFTNSLENKPNSETMEDDLTICEPKDSNFLETDVSHNHLFPCSKEDNKHHVDPLSENHYYIIETSENPTCPMNHQFPHKHYCHHYIKNQLSCPNLHYSYHPHNNEKNNMEILTKSNEERSGHSSFNERGACHGMIQSRHDLSSNLGYENKKVNSPNNLDSESLIRGQMLQKNIHNDSGGSISNQDQIYQLENSNLGINSCQIGPQNENSNSQNSRLKDDNSPSDRQQSVSLFSMEQHKNNQNYDITMNKDSKESYARSFQNEDNSFNSEKSDENIVHSSEKLNEDNAFKPEKANEVNTPHSDQSNQDDTLLSERSNQDNFLLNKGTNQNNSPLSEKLNEENNLHIDEDNSVKNENANENSYQSNEESLLHTEKLNNGDSLLANKSTQDNSLISQKINEENAFRFELPKVGNYQNSEKVDDGNNPLSENLSNNAHDISNPLQDVFQPPEKLNDNFLQANTNEGLHLNAKVDSTKHYSLDNAEYMSAQQLGSHQCSCQNRLSSLNDVEHSVGHMKQPCTNCSNAVPNWNSIRISYSNNNNLIDKFAKDTKGINIENDSKFNIDEIDETRDSRIYGNALILGQSQFLDEKSKIKVNDANVPSAIGMCDSEGDSKQKDAPKIRSSISLELCSSLHESPTDLLECPLERHIIDRGVMHNNFHGSVQKSESERVNRNIGRSGNSGKTGLIEDSKSPIKMREKDSNSHINKIEPNSISSQSKSSSEKFNKTLNSLEVYNNVDVILTQNISLPNGIKAKSKNSSLKQDNKVRKMPSVAIREKWNAFVLSKNNATLNHTPLKVPLVLSDDGRTVWTLYDYILETEKNPQLSQKNAYYYIYDSFTPLASKKSIKLLNGSTALQGDLIKEANYSYSAFLGLLNVKADLQLNIDPEVTSQQCIDVILFRQPNTNNKGNSVYGHSSDIFIDGDGKKAKYFSDSKDLYLQDKLLHQSIYLPKNKTNQPNRNKINPSNYLNQHREQNNSIILKIIDLPSNKQLKDYPYLLLKACNQRVENSDIFSPKCIEQSNLSNSKQSIPITVYNHMCNGPTLLINKNGGPDNQSQHKDKYAPREVSSSRHFCGSSTESGTSQKHDSKSDQTTEVCRS